MTSSPTELAWAARWKAVRPTAQYNPTWGIEGAWRGNADDWGYPLDDTEQDVEVDGQTLKGRTFSKAGMIVWNPSTGAQVIGWP